MSAPAPAPAAPPIRHLISLEDLSAREFEDLLLVAQYLKRRRVRGIAEKALLGKSLAMLFEKPSLRTRLSFEMAMAELGGQAVYVRGEEVGMGSREPTKDVARVLGRYVQGIMARVFKHQTILDLARDAGVPVINGLCDQHHPCQALADLLTIREHFGRTEGLKVVFVGDANNVARSLARACQLSGARFVLACPKAYAFGDADRARWGSAWGTLVSQVHDPAEASAGAHVLYTDVWTSMGQEAERERRLRDFQGFQINEALLAAAAPDCRVMHCLPAHRGEEITDGAVEHARSIIFDQAENRLHAQKAILRLLMADDAAAVVAAARSG